MSDRHEEQARELETELMQGNYSIGPGETCWQKAIRNAFKRVADEARREEAAALREWARSQRSHHPSGYTRVRLLAWIDAREAKHGR